MMYLISIPAFTDYHYWIITDTHGANMVANTPAQAIANFERQVFKLKGEGNDYSIAEHEILHSGKFHGRILAKANTAQSLINNYPEYFI